jgi:hypothetical protein
MVRSLSLAWSAAALVLPAAVAAQSFSFAYQPQVGTFSSLVHEVRGTVHYMGIPSLPDSVTAEYEAQVGETRRFVEQLAGAWIAHQTFDSVRARYRVQERQWRSIASRTTALQPIRMLVDDRGVGSPMGETPVEEAAIARGVSSGLQLQLPDAPVSPGDSWSAALRVPVIMPVAGDSARIIAVNLDGAGEATLDSLVARTSDTLAYVSVRGRLQPVVVNTVHPLNGTPATIEIWGSTLSSMIWSTGWGSWVSGGSSLLIRGRLEMPSGPADGHILADLTSRFQIRP